MNMFSLVDLTNGQQILVAHAIEGGSTVIPRQLCLQLSPKTISEDTIYFLHS
jgi:hypothetical protein